MKLIPILIAAITLVGCATKPTFKNSPVELREDGPDAPQRWDAKEGYNHGTGPKPTP